MKDIFLLRLGELIDGRDIAEFARSIGFNTETLRRYTTGERTPKGDFLYELCKATGVSSDWLLGLSDARYPVSSTPAGAAFGVAESSGLDYKAPVAFQVADPPNSPRGRLLRLYDSDKAVRLHIDKLIDLLSART